MQRSKPSSDWHLIYEYYTLRWPIHTTLSHDCIRMAFGRLRHSAPASTHSSSTPPADCASHGRVYMCALSTGIKRCERFGIAQIYINLLVHA